MNSLVEILCGFVGIRLATTFVLQDEMNQFPQATWLPERFPVKINLHSNLLSVASFPLTPLSYVHVCTFGGSVQVFQAFHKVENQETTWQEKYFLWGSLLSTGQMPFWPLLVCTALPPPLETNNQKKKREKQRLFSIKGQNYCPLCERRKLKHKAHIL